MLKSVSVTYKAPPGHNKVLEAFGHTFFDGKAETVTVDEDTLLRLQGNPQFKCGEAKEVKETETKADPKEQEAAEKAALLDENEKRAAQGLPPVEEEKSPHSKSGEGQGQGHGKEANEAHGKAKA